MNFDWSKFTKENYERYVENNYLEEGDYIGAVHVGDIAIDLVSHPEVNLLFFDYYVAHEDTGYGYKNGVLPYDYADGNSIELPLSITYEEFVEKAEKLFADYINSYKGDYSLIEHASRPLLMW